MRDNAGPNHYKLYGTVGDSDTDVRKMNIAYDFGADPRSLALTMYNKTPTGYLYHYWVYQDSCDTATRSLLYTIEYYHEPVAVAVGGGNHFVSVTGYNSERPAYPEIPGAGNIYTIYYNDPLVGSNQSKSYGDWCNFFTRFTDNRDPDPATDWYAQKTPSLWHNYWVTVERDSYDYLPDYGVERYGDYVSIIPPLLNTSGDHDDHTEDNWFSPTNVGSTQSTNWTYAGPSPSWYRAANGTLSYSNDYKASYSFTFTGISITRLYTMYYNRGDVQITLDGVDQPGFDSAHIVDSSLPPRWQVGKTWQVGNGDHTIPVTNMSSGVYGYFDLNEFIVYINAPGSGTYDDKDNSPVVYYGNNLSDWTHSTGWERYGLYHGTVSWNKTTGDGLRFIFTGNSITYYYNKAWNQGKIGIVIDGIDEGIIDAYNSTQIWDVPWTSPPLGYGKYTIEITVLGQKNPASTDYYIELDKFVVQ